jgi:hypothetical protein
MVMKITLNLPGQMMHIYDQAIGSGIDEPAGDPLQYRDTPHVNERLRNTVGERAQARTEARREDHGIQR